MPTPRKFANYSIDYANSFIKAVDKPHVITTKSESAARRLRSHIYAFRSAALSELPEGYEDLLLLLPQARTRIDGRKLIIYYQDIDKELRDAASRSHRTDFPVKDRLKHSNLS